MVSVELGRMDQVEYLIGQSAQGHHILFDTETIKRVFKNDLDTAIPQDKLTEVKQFLSELINRPSIRAKRDYLASLPEEIQHLLIKTYFNILENSIVKKRQNIS